MQSGIAVGILAAMAGSAAIQIEGKVSGLWFRDAREQYADPGDSISLTIPGFDDVAELPLIDPPWGATLVMGDFRETYDECRWLGTALRCDGMRYSLLMSDPRTPDAHWRHIDGFADSSMVMGWAQVVPEPDSRFVWGLIIILFVAGLLPVWRKLR